jgi:hypothetical protein
MKAYILKIDMKGLKSPVWRRVVVPAGATFQRLHAVIQRVTNFESEYLDWPVHLHEFRLPEENLLVTNEPEAYERAKKNKKGEGLKVRKPQTLKIDEYLEKYGKLSYTYDLGDNWEFDIQLEEVVDDYHFGYPTLLDGAGDAPPEDAGGVPGFEHLLEVLADKKHPDHEHMLLWSREQHFRPYDRNRINGMLKYQKIKKTEWDKIHHVNHEIVSDKYYIQEETTDLQALPEGFDAGLFWKYVRACTNLYGVVPVQEVIGIFNRQNPRMYLELGPAYRLVYGNEWPEVMRESYTEKNGSDFAHSWLIEEGKKEAIQHEQEGKDWYVPKKGELLKYADDNYVERSAAYNGLRNVLAPYFPKLHPIGVDSAIKMFARNLQLDASFNKSFGSLVRNIVLEGQGDLEKIAQQAVHFSNNHRLWANRGHAPSEISRRGPGMQMAGLIPAAQGEALIAGRNDPCPCGSGKKFKKCCGK